MPTTYKVNRAFPALDGTWMTRENEAQAATILTANEITTHVARGNLTEYDDPNAGAPEVWLLHPTVQGPMRSVVRQEARLVDPVSGRQVDTWLLHETENEAVADVNQFGDVFLVAPGTTHLTVSTMEFGTDGVLVKGRLVKRYSVRVTEQPVTRNAQKPGDIVVGGFTTAAINTALAAAETATMGGAGVWARVYFPNGDYGPLTDRIHVDFPRCELVAQSEAARLWIDNAFVTFHNTTYGTGVNIVLVDRTNDSGATGFGVRLADDIANNAVFVPFLIIAGQRCFQRRHYLPLNHKCGWGVFVGADNPTANDKMRPIDALVEENWIYDSAQAHNVETNCSIGTIVRRNYLVRAAGNNVEPYYDPSTQFNNECTGTKVYGNILLDAEVRNLSFHSCQNSEVVGNTMRRGMQGDLLVHDTVNTYRCHGGLLMLNLMEHTGTLPGSLNNAYTCDMSAAVGWHCYRNLWRGGVWSHVYPGTGVTYEECASEDCAAGPVYGRGSQVLWHRSSFRKWSRIATEENISGNASDGISIASAKDVRVVGCGFDPAGNFARWHVRIHDDGGGIPTGIVLIRNKAPAAVTTTAQAFSDGGTATLIRDNVTT